VCPSVTSKADERLSKVEAMQKLEYYFATAELSFSNAKDRDDLSDGIIANGEARLTSTRCTMRLRFVIVMADARRVKRCIIIIIIITSCLMRLSE